MNEVTKLDVHEFSRLTRPAVYTMYEGKQVVYIGSTCRGVLRAFDPKHPARRRGATPTNIVMQWFDDLSAAQKVEKELIDFFQPVYNRMGTKAYYREQLALMSSGKERLVANFRISRTAQRRAKPKMPKKTDLRLKVRMQNGGQVVEIIPTVAREMVRSGTATYAPR